MLHRQLGIYIQKHISDATALAAPHSESEALLQGLRLVLMVLAHDRSSADLLGGLGDGGQEAGELETRLAATTKELAEVRRQQTHQILPQAATRDILDALASVGARPASARRRQPSGPSPTHADALAVGLGAGTGAPYLQESPRVNLARSISARSASPQAPAAHILQPPPPPPPGLRPASLTLPGENGQGSATVTANLVAAEPNGDDEIGIC